MAEDMLFSFADVFAIPGGPLGRTNVVKHKIDTGDCVPVRERMRRYAPKQLEIIDRETDKMLSQDVIEPSNSPWSSPIVVVTKKDGSARVCLDVRKLNNITRKDAYPLPRIDHALESLNGAKYFCTLDLLSGYWQVPLAEDAKEKTAFSVPRRGHFQFKVMPFGLCNAPASFERLMEQILRGLQWDRCLVYLDDIIVTGKTVEEVVNNLAKVLTRLRTAGLKLKPSKCTLFARKVAYLGHIVSEEGIACDPAKVACVSDWPAPSDVHDVRSFLGLASYYRTYIPRIASIAEPLYNLTRKGVRFCWSESCQTAFQALKEALTSAPVLAYPDPEKSYILDTDASLYGIGAVLSQLHDGNERVIAYASHSLSKTQRNYCTTKRELLAVVTFVKHFRHYLYGVKFTVRTDHSSLVWLTNFKDPEGMLARWITSLEVYDFEIKHRRGKEHVNADSLSRRVTRPCMRPECTDCSHRVVAGPHGAVKQRHSTNSVCSHVLSEAVGAVLSPGNRVEAVISDVGSKVDVLAILPCTVVTWEDLANEQKLDTDIGQVHKWMEEGQGRPTSRDVDGHSHEIRILWGQWKLLEFHRGVLCRRVTLGPGVVVKQIILPGKWRLKVLRELHDTPLGGHRGIRKTTAKLQSRVYWPGMRGDVRRWCQTCPVCQSLKPGNVRRRYPLQQRLPGFPLERVAMDIIGPIRPATKHGNMYILVVEDYFSKYAEAYPLPDHTAQTVADIFVTQWVARHGSPLEIHTDQAAEYDSRLYKAIMRLLGIKKTRTSPYRPQSDGVVERLNRTLKGMLSAYVQHDYNSWDEYLPFVLMSYRSTVHESTGCTPNLLFFGRECNLPIDFFFAPPPDAEQIECPQEYVEWMRQAGQKTHEFVRRHLQGALITQKRSYDKQAVLRTFEPGELVYREYLPQAAKHKFASLWRGPYRVSARLSDVNYRIEMPDGTGVVVVHVDHLRRCIPRDGQFFQTENVAVESDSSVSGDEEENVIHNEIILLPEIMALPLETEEVIVTNDAPVNTEITNVISDTTEMTDDVPEDTEIINVIPDMEAIVANDQSRNVEINITNTTSEGEVAEGVELVEVVDLGPVLPAVVAPPVPVFRPVPAVRTRIGRAVKPPQRLITTM
jgi:transposase InsO family protein